MLVLDYPWSQNNYKAGNVCKTIVWNYWRATYAGKALETRLLQRITVYKYSMENIRETFKNYIRKIAQTGGRQLNYYKVFYIVWEVVKVLI